MKRIYLYFKERTEKGEFTSRGIQILFFWGLGLFSTIWFLVRVIPKPSRASYPCMQTAAPLMSAFVMYLLSFTGVWVSLRQLREAFRNRKVVVGVFAFAGFCFFGALMLVENSTDMLAQTFLPTREPRMAWGKNNPVGEAKGIYPGRVVWTHAPGAATWKKGEGFWFEDRWNNQADADWLLNQSLLSLTGEKKEKAAWKSLFIYFNQQHDKGQRGYKKGERIAIKINQNNTFSHEDCEQLNASPHLTLALLRSLVNDGGVPQEQITVFDASRFITGIDVFYNDNFINLMSVMKSAVSKYGRPKVLNFDNGKSYKNKQMELLAARIGTTLSYCQPYTPTSKAKIERWFRTLKDQWMAGLDMRDFRSLDELRGSLYAYVQSYNLAPHSSLRGMSPQDRFFSEPDHIRCLTQDNID